MADLDKRLNESLTKHLETGYEKDALAVKRILDAVKLGKIRIVRVEDDFATFNDLAGDIFNPEMNSDVDPKELKRQSNIFRSRLNRQGAWGYVAEFWTVREWSDEDTDSIFGFVGYDFFGSGYELLVMDTALDQYETQKLDSDGFVIDPFRLAS